MAMITLYPRHIDQLAEKVGGRFRLTKLVSERLRQVNAGSPLLVQRLEGESILSAICREVEQGLISLEVEEQAEAMTETNIDLLSLGEDTFDSE